MDDTLLVNLLDPLDQLSGDHQDRFEVEVSLARSEEVFQGWPKQVHDHDMELLVRHGTIRANVVEAGYTCYI